MASDSLTDQLFEANNDFSVRLFEVISKKEGNLFFSPLCAHLCLSLCYQGALETTKEALSNVLHVSDPVMVADGYNVILSYINDLKNVSLIVASKVFLKTDQQLKETFQETLVKKFLSEFDLITFEDKALAASTINEWVERKTNEKIKNVCQASDFDEFIRLVIVNAVYFNGEWFHKFKKDLTKSEKFFVDQGTEIDVEMMHATNRYNYKEDKELNCRVLEMKYQNRDFSMVIILPNEKAGIKDLEQALLKSPHFGNTTEGLSDRQVNVRLPKFRIEQTIDFKTTLIDLGLGIIFDDKRCNLKGMIEGPEELSVSKITQKSYIDVNEEGSEAAAATCMLIKRKYAKWSTDDDVEFLADHPFIFLLVMCYQDKRIPVFMGKVLVPEKSMYVTPMLEQRFKWNQGEADDSKEA